MVGIVFCHREYGYARHRQLVLLDYPIRRGLGGFSGAAKFLGIWSALVFTRSTRRALD
jgi:hypothetical protein